MDLNKLDELASNKICMDRLKELMQKYDDSIAMGAQNLNQTIDDVNANAICDKHINIKFYNLFDCVSEKTCGIASIADLIKNSDTEKLEEFTVNHLAYLLQETCNSLLEISESGHKLIKENGLGPLKNGADHA